MEEKSAEVNELEDLDIEEEVYQIIKNSKHRVAKPKLSTLTKLILGGIVAVSMFTSCQTATYTLQPGYAALDAAQEMQTRTMSAEVGSETWSEVFGQSGYIHADNTAQLSRQQSLVKMDIQDRRLTFVTNIDIYKQHKKDVDWVYEYVATIMNTVSPGISFAKAFSEDAIADDTKRVGSSIFVGLKGGLDGMAEHGTRLNHVDPQKGPIYDETITLNADWEKLGDSSYFRIALLREVMSALGLQDIKKSLGGNIMSDIDQLKDCPLALSPAEMADLFVLYGDVSRANFNDQYLEWYAEQFMNAEGLATIDPASFHYDRNAGLEV